LYVDGAVVQWHVIGGRSGNTAGEGPNQKYGIQITAVAADQYTIIGTNVSGNVTQGISDSGTGASKQVFAVADYAAGVLKHDYEFSDKVRFSIGDGNFRLGFKDLDPDRVNFFRDDGDYQTYDRALDTLYELISNAPITYLSALGLGVFGDAATCAALAVTSTSQGVLFPRMTETQRDAIASPLPGLVIWNNTTGTLNVYNSSVWQEIATVP